MQQPIQQPRAFNPWARPRPPGAPVYQPAPVQSSITPYLEISVESTRAYVHQNLVMTIQVVSPVQVDTRVTNASEGMLRLDAMELPAEFRLEVLDLLVVAEPLGLPLDRFAFQSPRPINMPYRHLRLGRSCHPG